MFWSNSNPGHFPITLFLDKKQQWSLPEEDRSPQDLFDLFYTKLGSKLYLPKEQAKLNDLKTQTPAQWVWPTAFELRGRIIVVINGGNFIKAQIFTPLIQVMKPTMQTLTKFKPLIKVQQHLQDPMFFIMTILKNYQSTTSKAVPFF